MNVFRNLLLDVDGLLPSQQWQKYSEELVFHWQNGCCKERDSGFNLSSLQLSVLAALSIWRFIVGVGLYTMDLKSNNSSPFLTDPAPIPLNNTQLGIHSGLLPYSLNGSAFSSTLLLTIPRRKSVILDDLRSSLLDAMILSSPTHKKLTKDSSTELTASDSDFAYRNWMVMFHFFSFGIVSSIKFIIVGDMCSYSVLV